MQGTTSARLEVVTVGRAYVRVPNGRRRRCQPRPVPVSDRGRVRRTMADATSWSVHGLRTPAIFVADETTKNILGAGSATETSGRFGERPSRCLPSEGAQDVVRVSPVA